MAIALVLATSLLQSEEEVPTGVTDLYRCWVGLELDGFTGALWRDFEPGEPDEFYKIQIYNSENLGGPFATWSVDNRPPRRRKSYEEFGLPELEAFRNGPEGINFGTIEYRPLADGAISARLSGDGVYAGIVLAQRARLTRRVSRLGGAGLTLSISNRGHPQIFAKVGKASVWEAVLVDASGSEIGRKSVRVPSPAIMEAEFNRSRADLLRHRDEFLTRPTWNRTKVCSTRIDERDGPI